MRPKELRYLTWFTAALLSGVALLSLQRGWAQSSPACEPPSANEYLLLVTNQQSGTEEQLRQLLPANAAITSCQYLDDEVVRVGGFASAEIANAWAKYVTDMTGLQAVVARPTAEAAAPDTSTPNTGTPETATNIPVTPASPAASSADSAAGATNFPTPTQTPAAAASSPTPAAPAQSNTAELPSLNQSPAPSAAPTPTPAAPAPAPSVAPSTPASSPAAAAPTAATTSFDPKPLGAGYAVLVNYANRPEVAADVRQVTSQPVGLVSYNQRPFLLAAHTTDPAAATAVLQSLNDRGFNAIIIDSRSAILLTPAVVGTGG